jgi:hypothetical protein
MTETERHRMTEAERQRWRFHAKLLNQQIYVFRSQDEMCEPIWVYDVLPPMNRMCEIFGPGGLMESTT